MKTSTFKNFYVKRLKKVQCEQLKKFSKSRGVLNPLQNSKGCDPSPQFGVRAYGGGLFRHVSGLFVTFFSVGGFVFMGGSSLGLPPPPPPLTKILLSRALLALTVIVMLAL